MCHSYIANLYQGGRSFSPSPQSWKTYNSSCMWRIAPGIHSMVVHSQKVPSSSSTWWRRHQSIVSLCGSPSEWDIVCWESNHLFGRKHTPFICVFVCKGENSCKRSIKEAAQQNTCLKPNEQRRCKTKKHVLDCDIAADADGYAAYADDDDDVLMLMLMMLTLHQHAITS